jgi:hypothetical protein
VIDNLFAVLAAVAARVTELLAGPPFEASSHFRIKLPSPFTCVAGNMVVAVTAAWSFEDSQRLMSGHGAINSIEVSRIPLLDRLWRWTESFEFRASRAKVLCCAWNFKFFGAEILLSLAPGTTPDDQTSCTRYSNF